ncbi:MAG TPA: iron-dependent repressor [Flavobacteriales bacterium]|nr:iron-dependent repressor [Flavobacteriales bacterium]
MTSLTEEDYIKAIYKLYRIKNKPVSTNAIAEVMEIKPSSVTDMIKKLSAKGFLEYEKYKGVSITEKGKKKALQIIRKHRLWEFFLVEKLNFKWDEIHVIAEQLEHIDSDELIDKLEGYLNYPKFDPHGDPIPDKHGNITHHKDFTVFDLEEGKQAVILGLKTDNADLLKFLDTHQIKLQDTLKVLAKNKFDNSVSIEINGKQINFTEKTAKNIYVKTIK